MTPLQTVKEACIAANRSILDLVFGCRVENKNKKYTIFREIMDGYFVATDEKGAELHVSKLNNQHTATVILGRDIRLADVLLAVGKDETDVAWKDVTIPLWKIIHSDITGSSSGWNLLHDSLDWHATHQPETVKFLAELLGK